MRALVIVLNGVGAGGAPDASKFRDEGANTLGHLFEFCNDLELPALFSLGLGEVLGAGTRPAPAGSYGRMRGRSAGKDTITGHWEIAGVVSQEFFAAFERFPETLVRAIEQAAKVKFIGNDAGNNNGAILDTLGVEYMKTGRPVLCALPDSVMQIFAHEEIIPRDRLYEIARIARKFCNTHRISRVVAQPFTGAAGRFVLSPATREYPAIPPRTVLNAISETGLDVEGIGDVSAHFAGSGITRKHPAQSSEETLGTIEQAWDAHREGLILAGLAGLAVHARARRLRGFAEALQRFDQWLAGFLHRIGPEDLLIITADQGCDPTFPGTGYTREEVPLLVKYDKKAEPLGVRLTFADVAATLASYFHLREPWRTGTPFFKFPRPTHLPRRY